MIAIVIGGTGATGKELIQALLRDPNYTRVHSFVRKTGSLVHEKLVVHAVDFDDLSSYQEEIQGDVLFSCLGTTLKAAGSRENQWKIDVDLPYHFAKVARQNGVDTLILVSAYGVKSDSPFFYSRMKGVLEQKMESLQFQKYVIFRPGLLDRPDSDRFGERLMVRLMRMVNAMGLVRKYRPLPVHVLAAHLAKAPQACGLGKVIVELEEIS